ncbi:magnesium-translocating P-type ATPase [[Clostridium] symbiosum]|uniref:magnesium-translocating P-type ATPase n=1 Tax=Clostridium symbiosum TaxID=1512 RepID=UPI0001FAB5DF|nr:magnesium-translocating P-type ATPase [[Clostridium] symbiosum]EGB18495.1 magnesium-importing ATPase [[Clostridium] symbiosum WAL-14673]
MSKTTLFDSRIKKYAYREASQIYQDIGVSSDGLSHEQVEAMREKYGANSFAERKNDTMIRRLRRAFINPFNVILFILGIISLVTDVFLVSNFARNATTAIIIFSMILISGAIRLIQELRAKNAAQQLNRLIHESITVRREGELIEISAEKLVVGDIVLLSAGNRVPADIRLTEVTDLFISQAAITGESAILEKNCRALSYSSLETLTQLENLAFMATTVISGKGEGIVLAVGKDTLYGSFAKPDSDDKKSFQKGANSIAWVMLRFIAVLIPIVFALLGITGGKWLESFAFALSVAVGLMPEMLPMVITACLARGSLTMSRKQTIIKDINAMQGFGSMDVLCMDKTGTLTTESILLEYYMDVLGNESSEVLDLAFLNSFYHSGVRNPIDNAILACQTMPKRETHYADLLTQYQKTDEIPFDYARKFVSTLVTDKNGESQLIMKGDISHIVARCSHVEYRDKNLPIEKGGVQSVSSVVDEMLQDGMKVIAVARKNVGQQNQITPADEEDMILMGYLAFFDAPKKTAKVSVAALKRLKVTPKILTGDQADVAVSVCRRVGISSETVLTGANLDEMADSELSAAVEKIHVFAELTPGQKVRLVSALCQNGHTVGFLGDGINDIPALCEANVGISVDTAVDAAKDAADVVLLQKDLGVLEQGILEGRKTFTNMLKYIKITASSNFGNILSIVCASAFLPFLPMTSVQILLLNLLYDVLCIILPWDNVDEEETVSPRDWSGRTLGRFMLSFGPISSLFDIVTFLFLYYFLCPMLCGGATYLNLTDPALRLQYVSLFQTGWFLESMWTQVLILHFLRTRRIPFVQSRPSAPVICITLAGIVAFTAITFTKGASLFGLTKLPLWYLVFLLIVALLYMLLTTVVKTFYQKKYHELI